MITDNLVRLQLIPRNARLVDARKEKGWTQKQLGDLVGLHPSHISAIEVLRLIPNEFIMGEVATALEKSTEYLFPDSLMTALQEGVFRERITDLAEANVILLTEAVQARLLPQVATHEEVFEDAEDRIDIGIIREQIEKILPTLVPREEKVIRMRFGLDDDCPLTLEEVGREFGVNRERIRQIEAKALRKLRHPSRSKKLKSCLAEPEKKEKKIPKPWDKEEDA